MLDDKTLEKLKLSEETLLKSIEFWNIEANKKCVEWEKLNQSDNSDIEQLEKLQTEISLIKNRLDREENAAAHFFQKKKNLLLMNLVSGVNSIKL